MRSIFYIYVMQPGPPRGRGRKGNLPRAPNLLGPPNLKISDFFLSTLDFYSRLSTFTLDSRQLLSTLDIYSRLSTFRYTPIWVLIALFLTNQIAGNTIDFKMDVINVVMTCNLNLVFNQQHIATQSKKSLVQIYAYLKKIKGYCIKFLCQRR